MSIYLLTLALLIIFGLAYESFNTMTINLYNKKAPYYFFTVPSFLLLFFISVFRGDFTTDYKNYTSLFNLYNKYSFSELLNSGFKNEIGYIYLNKVLGLFTDDAIYFFAIMTFVTLFGFFHHFKKYSVNIWLSVLMFVTAGSYYASFNITRHIFAVAIVFVGSKYLYERKFFKWVLVIILATLFHKTAIIMIPFYFILNFRIKLKNWVLFAIFSVIVILFLTTSLILLNSIFMNNTQMIHTACGDKQSLT